MRQTKLTGFPMRETERSCRVWKVELGFYVARIDEVQAGERKEDGGQARKLPNAERQTETQGREGKTRKNKEDDKSLMQSQPSQ